MIGGLAIDAPELSILPLDTLHWDPPGVASTSAGLLFQAATVTINRTNIFCFG